MTVLLLLDMYNELVIDVFYIETCWQVVFELQLPRSPENRWLGVRTESLITSQVHVSI